MIQIAKQPLTKTYTASVLSRSTFISYMCYILIIIIPAAVLININYSWPQSITIFYTPSITYHAYQLTCTGDAGIFVYDSSFDNQISPMSYVSMVSVAVDDGQIYVSGTVLTTDLQACSVLVYLLVKYDERVESLVQLPISYMVREDGHELEEGDVAGRVSVELVSPIPQSSVLSLEQTGINNYSQPFTFTHNLLTDGQKNLTLTPTITYNSLELIPSNNSSPFTFNARYKVLNTITLRYSTLLEKIRAFLPSFISIVLVLWLGLVQGVLAWMLRNKIYVARASKTKLKQD